MSTRRAVEVEWRVGPHEGRDGDVTDWVPASIPGAVQLDVAAARGWEPWWVGDNWRDYRWMEDSWWTYRARFAAPDLAPGERLIFTSKGIDYHFDIRFNDRLLLSQEGMFSPVDLDLTDWIEPENELTVNIRPAPKTPGEPENRRQARTSCKPPCAYGWDWHPRLVPLGIWDDTTLEVCPAAHLAGMVVDTVLNDALDDARVTVYLDGCDAPGATTHVQVRDPDGATIIEQHHVGLPPELHLEILDVRLWWPHDHGPQPLYTLTVEVVLDGAVVDRRDRRFGLRRSRLVMWDDGKPAVCPLPIGRNAAPITLEINGRRIFAKGTNWVCPEVFPGTVTATRYEELLRLAKAANFNLLRCWGGAFVDKDAFFECCDELGIMVWQEFPLACNNYPDDPAYLRVLEQESESIIERLQGHPSVVIWCGGNELFLPCSGMDDQSLAIRLLDSQCLHLDPHTPFLPTSPVMGMGHGHYLFRDPRDGREVFEWMPEAECTAYTEFGMPAAPSVETLESFLPEAERWPPALRTAWHTHHAFGAWGGFDDGPEGISDTWICLNTLRHYFGDIAGIPDLVAYSQWLQGEGYRCIYEEARRQKPRCAMALNWCYNEPWPCAANNTLVAWPLDVKPAHAAVAAACRPVLASAAVPHFSWQPNTPFTTRLWLLNDRPDPVPGGTMTARLVGPTTVDLGTWNFPDLPANENAAGPELTAAIPAWTADRFDLVVEVAGHPRWRSVYTLHLHP